MPIIAPSVRPFFKYNRAAIYTPVDYGYPDNGILAIGEMNQAQWVYADINLAGIAKVRKTGQVFNYRDWPGQFRCL